MIREQPELAQYVRFVRRHALVLVACALMGLLSAAVWHAQRPLTYTATSSVLLTPVPGFVDTDPSGRSPRSTTVDTDAQLVRSSGTVGAVARAVGESRRAVVAALHMSAPSLTQVLRISFTAASPRDAQVGAATAARSLIAARREFLASLQPDQIAALQLEVTQRAAELDALRASGGTPERILDLQSSLDLLRARIIDLYGARGDPGEVLQAAQRPVAADAADPEVALTTGVMLGLSLGCAIAALREVRQRRRSVAGASANRVSTSSPNRSAASTPAG